MCEEWRLCLLKSRDELASDISFDLVAPCLIERGIISADEYSTLREKKENKSQVEEIATLLATHKSEDVYLKFLDYLETDYDWLALQLKECTLSQEERQNLQSFINNNKRSKDTSSLTHLHNTRGSVAAGNKPEHNINQTTIFPNDKQENNVEKTFPSVSHQNSYLNSNLHVNIQSQGPGSFNNVQHTGNNCTTNPDRNRDQHDRRLNLEANKEINLNLAGTSSQGAYMPARNSSSKEAYLRASNISSSGSCSSLHPPCSTPNYSSQTGTPPRYPGSPANLSSTPSIPSMHGSSPIHSTRSIPGSSPVHSSDLSICSTNSGHDHAQGLPGRQVLEPGGQQRGTKRGYQDSDEISEEMIEYISGNPLIMKKWQNLAHQTGLSSRVPVIQARIRQEARDFDEHISEFIREWMERKPGEATVGGIIALLRKLKFNETAMRIEDGSYRKKLNSF